MMNLNAHPCELTVRGNEVKPTDFADLAALRQSDSANPRIPFPLRQSHLPLFPLLREEHAGKFLDARRKQGFEERDGLRRWPSPRTNLQGQTGVARKSVGLRLLEAQPPL
jgi:hypothetical protein